MQNYLKKYLKKWDTLHYNLQTIVTINASLCPNRNMTYPLSLQSAKLVLREDVRASHKLPFPMPNGLKGCLFQIAQLVHTSINSIPLVRPCFCLAVIGHNQWLPLTKPVYFVNTTQSFCFPQKAQVSLQTTFMYKGLSEFVVAINHPRLLILLRRAYSCWSTYGTASAKSCHQRFYIMLCPFHFTNSWNIKLLRSLLSFLLQPPRMFLNQAKHQARITVLTSQRLTLRFLLNKTKQPHFLFSH